MGWSWSVFGVIGYERLGLGGGKGQNRHTNHRARVYQTAYLEILRSAIGTTGRGEAFVFGDGSPFSRLGVFNILIAILDYEEA